MEFKSLKFEAVGMDPDARTFEGYAAAYGNVDSDNDIIEQNAFAKSIKEGFPSGRIKVLWQHKADSPIGMPVDMREDGKGLWVKSRISMTAKGDEAIELMRDGVVDRMSIGFSIPGGKSEWDAKMGVRRIKEVKLFEFSPVTFPANEMATIEGVKNLEGLIAFAKSGKAPQETFAKLQGVYLQLEALLKSHPATETQEPQIDPEFLQSIEQLKSFATTRLY
jgi:HK97 family phage prohead protease